MSPKPNARKTALMLKRTCGKSIELRIADCFFFFFVKSYICFECGVCGVCVYVHVGLASRLSLVSHSYGQENVSFVSP